MKNYLPAAVAAVALLCPSPLWAGQDNTTAQTERPIEGALTLDNLLLEAEARSPALVAAKADIEMAEALLRQAGYRPNPSLNVEAENILGNGSFSNARSLETTVAVEQRLELGGQRRARIEAGLAALEVATLRYAIHRADIAFQVRQAFAQVEAAQSKLDLADQTVSRNEELVRIANTLVDVGREPPLRAIRARAALARSQSARMAASADLATHRLSLGSILGLSAPVHIAPSGSKGEAPAPIPPQRSLAALLSRAETNAARARLEAERAAARLDPTVGIGVRHVRESGDVGIVAGVSMPLRIFDRNKGNIEAARQAVTAASARETAAIVAATTQVTAAQARLNSARSQLQALEGSGLIEAEEALRLTRLAYREGKVSLLEVLDAQEAYTQTQLSLADARLELQLAIAELQRLSARKEI